MPYAMEKHGRCYKVMNTETGTEHAKCTSKKKAEAQIRLLEDAEMKKAGASPPKPPTSGVKNGASPPLTWRQFFTENTKGKKFSKENTLADHMKKLAAEWRQKKSS